MSPKASRSTASLRAPHEALSDRILEALERGVPPWRRPWGSPPTALAFPQNLTTSKRYRGINVMLLHATRFALAYPTSLWLTFRQALALDGHVRAGEKSTPIAFWKFFDEDSSDQVLGAPVVVHGDAPSTTRPPLLRIYHVFNVAQCELPEGVVPPLPEAPPLEFETAAALLAGVPNPPRICHLADHGASYSHGDDTIRMPLRSQFASELGYWNTLFHELIHSTGAEHRLNRPHGTFGDDAYMREELVAEIGAALLCQHAGLPMPELEEQTQAYIASWLRALRADKFLVIAAAQAAQRAVDHVLTHHNPEASIDADIAA